jgi:ubiquinone/menaquinone biosynthesis C-methylase UbiE
MMKNKLSENEKSERQHFDLLAKKYDSNYGYKSKFTQYKILKKIDEFRRFVTENCGNDKLVIVEMGCGTGEYTKHIAKMFPKSKIVGLDISNDILKVAKDKCKGLSNVTFMNKSAYDSGCKKGSVDVVCGFYFLHHVNIRKVGQEIDRILKNKGIGFFYEPNILNPVVYLIKSSKYIKKIVGDSPDEWAINPLKVGKVFNKMKVLVYTTEFIIPVDSLPFEFLKGIDQFLGNLTRVPLLNFFGGSAVVKLFKDRSSAV